MIGVRRPYHHESATALWPLLAKQRLRGVNPDRRSGVEPLRRSGEHSKAMATPAAMLALTVLACHSVRSCKQSREGDRGAWVTHVLHILHPGPCLGDETPVLLTTAKTNRGDNSSVDP